MAPDWLRFLTTALGLLISVGFYGTPTKAVIPHADVAAVSLAADTDSAPDAPSTDEAEGEEDQSEESEAEGE